MQRGPCEHDSYGKVAAKNVGCVPGTGGCTGRWGKGDRIPNVSLKSIMGKIELNCSSLTPPQIHTPGSDTRLSWVCSSLPPLPNSRPMSES